ncbi:hypothetical protein NX059_010047 [Plenodomus lindquistii]|nr:hypothetical protein NX059_010047 [Plenodomus lindquistii]
MIGLVSLHSLDPRSLALPFHLFLPSTQSSSKDLIVELAYQFLPTAWGKSYAAKAVTAVFEACNRAPAFWSPYEKVYVRGIVNAENPASQRVMAKIGVPHWACLGGRGILFFWRANGGSRVICGFLGSSWWSEGGWWCFGNEWWCGSFVRLEFEAQTLLEYI